MQTPKTPHAKLLKGKFLYTSNPSLLIVAVQLVVNREPVNARYILPHVHRRAPAQTVEESTTRLIDLDLNTLARVAEDIDPDLAGVSDLHLLVGPLVIRSDAEHDSAARPVVRAGASPADGGLRVEVVGLLAVGVHAAREDEVWE